MRAGISVSVEVTYISLSRFTSKTGLNILDFQGGHSIVVVKGGLVNEALVEHGFEEELEVAHEAGMVTELVLGEDGDKAVVLLGALIVNLGDGGESGQETEESEACHAVEETNVASLNTNNHSYSFLKEQQPKAVPATYAGVCLRHALDHASRVADDTRNARLQVVVIEPQVVGPV